MLATSLIKDAVQEFCTPLFLYDAETIKQNYTLLNKAFGEQAHIFYSLKANPNLSICSLLNNCGAGSEVCSWTELKTALLAGVVPENIIFVGPYKSPLTLKRSLELKIYAIVCESLEEFLTIARIAKNLKCTAPIILRINPRFTLKSAPLKMGGIASQFGMDEETIIKHENILLNTPHTKILGIHVYNGTRVLDATDIANNIQNVLTLAENLINRWQFTFECIDLGGGIGVPYYDNEKAFDLELLQTTIKSLLYRFKTKHPNTRLILESGRFLVATAGIMICQIKQTKKSFNQNFLITDAGMNCHLAATGTSNLLKRNFPIEYLKVSNDFSSQSYSYQISGPLCTPGDLLAKNILLPELKIGDLIIIRSSGAYGPTASPTLFLGHGYPAEVLIEAGKPYLIRDRDTADQILANQINIYS